MSKFIIRGGSPLKGTVVCQGLKNAATPLIASTLLFDQTCIFGNAPRLVDVETMLTILRDLGATTEYKGDHELHIATSQVTSQPLEKKHVARLRSSILFMGSLLARFGEVDMFEPGGCLIGARPLFAHLDAFEQLGVTVKTEGDTIKLTKNRPLSDEVTLAEFSVTATENCILLCVKEPGVRRIHIAAAEPHIQDLIAFLNSAGARIRWIGQHSLEIEGVQSLVPVRHTIAPDYIDAGTWAVAAAVTKGEITIQNVATDDLLLTIRKLMGIGLEVKKTKNSLSVKYVGEFQKFTKLQALPHPGFPTDLQAPFGLLATQAHGDSLIQDPLYEGRFGYLQELEKMGAEFKILNPHEALIYGPRSLKGTSVSAPDLRAGATIILAGLCARGETIIDQAEVIDRGYEDIVGRLQSLGASIERTP